MAMIVTYLESQENFESLSTFFIFLRQIGAEINATEVRLIQKLLAAKAPVRLT